LRYFVFDLGYLVVVLIDGLDSWYKVEVDLFIFSPGFVDDVDVFQYFDTF
jgi:hypothetical protein